MLELRDITVDDAFKEAVNKYPNNDAITYGDWKQSYSELDEKVNIFAARLIELGLRRGSLIGIMIESDPNAITMYLAASRIGAVAVLYNTTLKQCEIDSINIKVDYLYDNNSKSSFEKIVPRSFEFDKPNSKDDGFILFTSGTTGIPHAVVGSQYSRANSGLQQAADLGITPEDRVLVAMPTFHCFSLSVNVMATLFSGACLCIPKSRHVVDLLYTIDREKCTVMSCVPTLFHAIITRDILKNYDISSLRIGFVGGSSCNEVLFRDIENTLNLTLLSSLGQTEATAGITTTSIDDSVFERATTVGHPMNHIEIKIDENSEILVKGYVVMKGYYNDPEGTAKMIDSDGFLHTGDMGYFNENGNLIITGRIKDLIIRGGENISPLEIENLFRDDERIFECKAIGVPDSHYGEAVALFVVKNSEITDEEIKNKIKLNLADYKIPKYVRFIDELPKTSSGKIKVNDLKGKI